MSLSGLAPAYLAAVEDEMRRVVGSSAGRLAEYYGMLAYALGWLDEKGQPAPVGSGGKRIRPLLCLLACAAAGGDYRRALPLAAAAELLHNFSLIHDDIQDNSPLRRGRPTVWRRWGPAQAINAGDALFTLAHLAPHGLLERGLSPAAAVAALADFDRTCLVLTQGQYLDMSFEQRQRVTVDEYLEMIEGKTAALIAASARLGALAAEADPEQAESFSQYGRALGLAFQVQDDLLGIWGDPAVTGKSAHSDLEKRKKSLPVVYGLEHSAEFSSVYAQTGSGGEALDVVARQRAIDNRRARPAADDQDVDGTLAAMARLLDELGARTFCEQKAAALTAEARRHLEAAGPLGEAGRALRELSDQLLSRKQ